MPERPTYRVVQWATGNVGLRSLRVVIEHPDLELVGLFVYSDAKAGRDAGELCGLGPVGVTATQDVDEILALEADCVIYMGDRFDVDVLCRLLASGANVVATRGELHRPASLDPAVRERIEAACREGGTTVHSTGSSPGFISEALPLVLTSIQRRLDSLVIDEFADLSSRDSPELLFDLMGFGKDPSAFGGSRRWEHGAMSFGPSLSVVADALGLPLDSVEASGEVATARHTTQIAAGTIEAGTVAAQRMIATGMHKGEPLLTFRANWYCTPDIEPAWPLQASGWHVAVAGDAPLDVTVSFPVAPEDYAAMTPGLTAHRPVNAIPYVVAAEPGIRTIVDLPQVIAMLGANR
ncbi:MAG: dihydrodipicolinate reductase [Acidimicrobiales bacterium]|nr:dihydrodipicolinate reductase [Acidimicrobiales bacterium]